MKRKKLVYILNKKIYIINPKYFKMYEERKIVE